MKKFLLANGLFIIVLALFGFFGVFGPIAQKSVFGQLWYLDNRENTAHLLIGIICVISALVFSPNVQRWVIWIFAFVAITVAIYSIVTFHILRVNVEYPIEEVLYFTLGDLALWAALADRQNLKNRVLRQPPKEDISVWP